MINNYENFLIEQELKNWETYFEKVNEKLDWEEVTDKIFHYIDEAAKKGDRFLTTVAVNIFRYFKANPKVLVFVIGLLAAKHHFTKQELIGMIPEDTTVSAQELYDRSMEESLPDSWISDETESEDVVKYNAPMSGSIKKFLNALAETESTNTPDTINSMGYMGKYQFGEIALKDILKKHAGESKEDYESRIKKYWPKNFGMIKTEADYNWFKSKFSSKGTDFWPEHKQDLAMKQLLKNNKSYLGDYISKWVGKTKKGVKITESGLLAGAHLLGPSNVKRFLDSGFISKDGYGTPITEYIEKFGGYKLPL
jgi:hypothetical protein